MFQTTGARRRRFVAFVNRNLERALAVNTPTEGRIENNNNVVTEENPLFVEEQDVVLLTEEEQKRLRRLQKLHAMLLAIPRGIRNRLEENRILQELREAIAGLRVDQIPEAIMDTLNNFI